MTTPMLIALITVEEHMVTGPEVGFTKVKWHY